MVTQWQRKNSSVYRRCLPTAASPPDGNRNSFIEEGSVKVNGRVAHIGDKVDPMNDKVLVKGRKVSGRSKNKHYYIMLHKPRGYVTTMSDEMGRKCVAELVKDVPARIYPVGRLDRESEGLLLMTNDGEFANKVTHPAKHVYKVYRVTVRPEITEEQVTQMCSGMVIDGRKTAPCEVHVITKKDCLLYTSPSPRD